MPRGARRSPQDFDLSRVVRLPTTHTAGGRLPDGRLVELIQDPKLGSLKFISFDGSQYRIEDQITTKSQDFVPAVLDHSLRCAMMLPTRAVDSGPVSELFSEIRQNFIKYGVLEASKIFSHLALACWFPEAWLVPPCLLVTGPAMEANQVLRLLQLVVRHGLLLTSDGSAEFRSALQDFHPTLLISARHLTKGQLKALAAGCTAKTFEPWKNSVIGACFARGIYIDHPTAENLFPSFALRVHISPAPRGAPMLNEADADRIRSTLQPKLLGYRLRHLQQVLQSTFDLPDMGIESRVIGRLLGRCIVGDRELQNGIRSLLQTSEDRLRNDRLTDPDCVVIEAVLARSHEPETDQVRVGKIASDASVILNARGESIALKPGGVGKILSRLELFAKRDAKGQRLIFTEKVRERIHRLAYDHRVAAVDDGDKSARCLICKKVFGETLNSR